MRNLPYIVHAAPPLPCLISSLLLWSQFKKTRFANCLGTFLVLPDANTRRFQPLFFSPLSKHKVVIYTCCYGSCLSLTEQYVLGDFSCRFTQSCLSFWAPSHSTRGTYPSLWSGPRGGPWLLGVYRAGSCYQLCRVYNLDACIIFFAWKRVRCACGANSQKQTAEPRVIGFCNFDGRCQISVHWPFRISTLNEEGFAFPYTFLIKCVVEYWVFMNLTVQKCS